MSPNLSEPQNLRVNNIDIIDRTSGYHTSWCPWRSQSASEWLTNIIDIISSMSIKCCGKYFALHWQVYHKLRSSWYDIPSLRNWRDFKLKVSRQLSLLNLSSHWHKHWIWSLCLLSSLPSFWKDVYVYVCRWGQAFPGKVSGSALLITLATWINFWYRLVSWLHARRVRWPRLISRILFLSAQILFPEKSLVQEYAICVSRWKTSIMQISWFTYLRHANLSTRPYGRAALYSSTAFKVSQEAQQLSLHIVGLRFLLFNW